MTWKDKPLFQSELYNQKSKAKPITPEQLASTGSEEGEQSALFCWAALNYEKYPQLKNLFAIPNANSHKMINEGVRGGVPDTMLAWPIQFDYEAAVYHGLFIEMKIEKRRNHKNGGLSDNQIDWIERLSSARYCCRVCYTWQEARDTLINYLEGKL